MRVEPTLSCNDRPTFDLSSIFKLKIMSCKVIDLAALRLEQLTMPRRALDRGDWEGWRPTLVEWYRYRTADSIAEELKSDYGLNVTLVYPTSAMH